MPVARPLYPGVPPRRCTWIYTPPGHPLRSLCPLPPPPLQGRRRAASYYAWRAIRCALLINFCRRGRKLPVVQETRPPPLSGIDSFVFSASSIFFSVHSVLDDTEVRDTTITEIWKWSRRSFKSRYITKRQACSFVGMYKKMFVSIGNTKNILGVRIRRLKFIIKVKYFLERNYFYSERKFHGHWGLW